jgi:Transglycosylase SLT domain
VVHALATANDKQFNEILGKWEQGKKGARTLAGDMSDTLIGTMQELIEVFKDLLAQPAKNYPFYANTAPAEATLAVFMNTLPEGVVVDVGIAKSKHSGGWIEGPGGGPGLAANEALIRAEIGEWVVDADTAARHRALLEDLPKFHIGGLVGGETFTERLPRLGGQMLDMSALLGTYRGTIPFDFASGALGFDYSTLGIPGTSAQLTAWLLAGLALAGRSGIYLPAEQIIAKYESGGNPFAVNPTPTPGGYHATGLMQTIPPTFYAYAEPGHTNIFNPVDNTAASVNYQFARYGSPNNVPGVVSIRAGGPYLPYAEGGLALEDQIAALHGGELMLPLEAQGTHEALMHALDAAIPDRIPDTALSLPAVLDRLERKLDELSRHGHPLYMEREKVGDAVASTVSRAIADRSNRINR